MKKLVSIAIVIVMALTFCTTAFATDVSTYTTGAFDRKCDLSISGTTATCKSVYTANGDDVAKVVITQSLEKQGFFWTWSKVAGEWTKTSDGSSMALTNTVSGLDKGTYRVRTVFTVTDKNGKEETIPLYSTTEKVG
ncbi:MAG: hypothetical protein HDT43_08050 [Ruminococcaceae bacterium]|nr:hypothetical protein [Oscillospiraceae bacterium]